MPPLITTASLTLRGRVNTRVAKVFVDGVEITLGTDKAFAHIFTAPTSGMMTFTTIDSDGHSESRAVTVVTTSPPAADLTPPMAVG
jgi:hypothetical protein